MAEQPTGDAAPADAGNDRWPDRLRASASLLCRTGLSLQAALHDERRFTLLTDPDAADDQALAEIRDFNRLLVTALTALIDLTGYDNPEQEYPDLATWFEFRCSNVVFGRHTDTFSLLGPDATIG